MTNPLVPNISIKTSASSIEDRVKELQNCTFPHLGHAALLVTESLLTART